MALYVYPEALLEEVEVSASDQSENATLQYPTYPEQRFQYSHQRPFEELAAAFAQKIDRGDTRCLQLLSFSYGRNVLLLHDFFQTALDLVKAGLQLHEYEINVLAPNVPDIVAAGAAQQIPPDQLLYFAVDHLARLVRFVFNKARYCVIASGTSAPFALQLQKYDRLCNHTIICNPIGTIRLEPTSENSTQKIRRASSTSVPDVEVSNQSVSDELGPATLMFLKAQPERAKMAKVQSQ